MRAWCRRETWWFFDFVVLVVVVIGVEKKKKRLKKNKKTRAVQVVTALERAMESNRAFHSIQRETRVFKVTIAGISHR